MRRLMRDEWQFGLGQISSLQRHPKPEISTGPPLPNTRLPMPKDNEVDEKVMPDNAARATPVAWQERHRKSDGSWDNWRMCTKTYFQAYAHSSSEDYQVRELVPATTVTALEAEVERLQRALTLANGWNGDPQVSARTAVENANALTDIQRQRADAAERRVADAMTIATASLRAANQIYEDACHNGDDRGQSIANVRISLASSIVEALTGAGAK